MGQRWDGRKYGISSTAWTPKQTSNSLTWNSETFFRTRTRMRSDLALWYNFRFVPTARRRLRMLRSASSR